MPSKGIIGGVNWQAGTLQRETTVKNCSLIYWLKNKLYENTWIYNGDNVGSDYVHRTQRFDEYRCWGVDGGSFLLRV